MQKNNLRQKILYHFLWRNKTKINNYFYCLINNVGQFFIFSFKIYKNSVYFLTNAFCY